MTSIAYESPAQARRPYTNGGASYFDPEAWLSSGIVQAEQYGQPIMRQVVLTPAIAQALISRNEGNRKVTRQHVNMLADAMRRGEWRQTHEAIAVSKTGRLLDGQHRAMAVIASGVSIETAVVFGLDDEAFAVINIGRNRSASDAMAMAGMKSVYVLGAIARACLNIERSKESDRPATYYKDKHSNTQILAWCERSPETQGAIVAYHHANTAFSPISSGYAAGLVLILKAGASVETVRQFNEIVASGVGLDTKGNPILRLRQIYANQAAGLRRVKSVEHAVLAVKAWNAWRAGEEIGLLSVKSNERFPASIKI